MRLALSGLILGSLMLGGIPAHAQNTTFGQGMSGSGGSGMGGIRPATAKKKAKPKVDPNMPVTHAASGASDTLMGGGEPTLPLKPLEMDDELKAMIGSDMALDEPEMGRSIAAGTERDWYLPYYAERSGDFKLRTLFPLWFERRQPSYGNPKMEDRASLFGGIYYNRRSADHHDDILFPVYWNLMDRDSRTTVIGPYVNRRQMDGDEVSETDDWLAPLYFTGTRPGNNGYTIIPPLLTYNNWDEDGGTTVFGPYFCSWETGANCDYEAADEIDRGIAPFYFWGHDEHSDYKLAPPLLWYNTNDHIEASSLTVVGPVYRKHWEDLEALHVFPFYYSLWGENERHTTLLPFFHYGHQGEQESLFVNPLFLSATGEKGEKTFVTWGYARYRGRTQLDMYTPLVWHYRDPDIKLEQEIYFPFYMSRESPREDTKVYFPLYANSKRFGVSETTFVTPFFQHSHDLRGWSTAVHPLFYVGRNGYDTHTVAAPFFWDFASRDSRTTIAFPLYWRFADKESTTQLVGNVFYKERPVRHGTDWQVHIFPLFSYGETPNGHWWNILYGLAGYTRAGKQSEIRTLWIPLELSPED
ncbi:MAG: hypothetical protein HRU17_13310 [Polyangiaceae bacterium]|nr:hypothetical protein [Polyangiaceae bacterium]